MVRGLDFSVMMVIISMGMDVVWIAEWKVGIRVRAAVRTREISARSMFQKSWKLSKQDKPVYLAK